MSDLERFKSDRKLLTPQYQTWLNTYLSLGSNYPVTLEIDPANKCPLACPHCIWNQFRAETLAFMPASILKKVTREAAEIGVKSIIWTGGGDPLANPGTLEAIKLSSELGMKNGMFTSAVPLTPKATEVVLNSVAWVRIHVDGATPQTYSAVHKVPESVFYKVTGNIRHFTTRRIEKKSRTAAGIGTVALPDNIDEAGDLARLTKNLGLDYFQYKHDLTQMSDPRYLKWWEKQVVPLMDKLSAELEDSSFKLQYSKGVNYQSPDPSKSCHVHHLNTAITADGRVAYCKSLRGNAPWSLGSVYRASLKEIFDGERHRQLKMDVIPSTCGIRPCPYKDANMAIEQAVAQNNISLLGKPVQKVEHDEFF